VPVLQDRDIFAKKLMEIGEPIATSISAVTVKEALAAGEKIGCVSARPDRSLSLTARSQLPRHRPRCLLARWPGLRCGARRDG
jgi:hypothetical protein